MSLENCEVEKDISTFIQERGTGQEIPDPPKYIDFCRGDADDTASSHGEDDNYSVAQFQRTINPAFRSSSPQPSTFESHHDPGSDLAARMGLAGRETPPSRERTLTPQTAAHSIPPLTNYQNNTRNQVTMPPKAENFPMIPHNEYPADGMTMLCRDAPASDRSSAASPNRPSSRDSQNQSDYSNPTSFSSQEPASGQHSPTKESASQPSQSNSPAKAIQKKRSGFFSNSPFRRKSKHEKEPPAFSTPTSRNTMSTGRKPDESRGSPTKFYDQPHSRDTTSRSPEPVDPRAKFQLNVGNNVFDVASPDKKPNRSPLKGVGSPMKELDPIAAALEELKGVNKQSSVRMSADRYAGVATPGPGSQASTQASEAPPSYNDAPMSRLGAPKPAFTSAQMKKTTAQYVNKNQDMYGTSRHTPRGSGSEMPRATSPRPMRSVSPRPQYQGRENRGLPRSASPNPYGGSRQRQTPNASPEKGRYSHQSSPTETMRATSPQPRFAKQERPNSSGNMHVQLSNGPPQGRAANRGRPMTFYGGQSQQQPQDGQVARPRAKSVADGRKFTADGRPILQMGKLNLPALPQRFRADCYEI